MRKIYYVLGVLLISTLTFIACTSDGDGGDVKRLKASYFNDLTIYVGSPSGGVERNIGGDTISNLDSLKRQMVYRAFENFYFDDISALNKRTIEFAGDRVTYTYRDSDDNIWKKIVSSYKFINDSLYVYKTSGDSLFVGSGTRDSLVVVRGFSLYPTATIDTMRITGDAILDLNTVLQYSKFPNLVSITSSTDSILWCNVMHVYK